MKRLAARLLIASLVLYATPALADEGPLLFEDDFESGLGHWIVSDPEYVEVVDSPDGAPGRVLKLTPEGSLLLAVVRRLRSLPPAEPVFALIPGSDQWSAYRLEGRLYFPEANDSYLGVIYHYREAEGRADFGSIYAIAKADER